jgi:16S rRNA (cytosine967-C5)-methyltransferase
MPEIINIFDMCAAPGGKTAYLMNALPKAFWHAGDRPARAHLVTKNVKFIREKLNVEFNLIAGDSCKTDFKDESLDAILLDAPCSATGSRPKTVFVKGYHFKNNKKI